MESRENVGEEIKKSMRILGFVLGGLLLLWGASVNYIDPAILGMAAIVYSM